VMRYIYIGSVIFSHPGPSGDPHIEDSGVDDEVLPGKTHFARNRNIVNASDLIVGCPGVNTWQHFGGTFYTINYAIRQKKSVRIIWPDGRVEER
jgi:hypothetical protein